MRKMKKGWAFGLAITLLASVGLAGCGGVNGKEAAITVNGETLSMGTANLWLRYQQAETYTMMENYGLDPSSMWSSDYTADSSSEESQSYGEMVKESYMDEVAGHMLLRQHADDYGVSIPEDLQKMIDETAASSLAANTEAFKKIGATEENIKEMLSLLAFRKLMYEPMVADTDTEVTDEEAAQTTISYIRIFKTATDEEGNSIDPTEEQLLAWRTELTSMIQEIKATGDVATADMSAIKDDIYPDATFLTYSYGSDDTVIDDQIKEAIADLSDGELCEEVIETDDYFTIVRLDARFDEEATASKKESIVDTRKSENFEEKLQSWKDEADIQETAAWEAMTITDREVFKAVYNAE